LKEAAPAPAWLAFAPVSFVLLWSTGFIGARLGTPHAPPLTFLAIRYAIVVLVLVGLALATRAAWPRSWREAFHIGVAGFLVQAVYLGGVFTAIANGFPAGVTALVVGLQPVLTALLAKPLLGETLRLTQWAGVAVGFFGVVLVVFGKLGHGTLTGNGLLLTIMSLLGITFGTLYQKRYAAHADLRTGGAIQFMVALVVTLPLAWFFETEPVRWTGEFIFALGWLVLVLSVGAMSLLFAMLRHGAASRVASLMYLTPAVTAVMAYLLFDERLPTLALAGLAVTAIGVFLVMRKV
jgi:drug/metabolite transporter (DMT)-like permease